MRLPLKQSKDWKFNAVETHCCTEYTATHPDNWKQQKLEGELNQLLPHSSGLTSNRLSSNPFPPRGIGSQGTVFLPSPDVKDGNCWTHSSAISSDPVHHCSARHSWLAHAALLHFPCCSSAPSREQRCWRDRDGTKQQHRQNLGGKTEEEHAAVSSPPPVWSSIFCSWTAGITCFLGKEKQTAELPTYTMCHVELCVSDSMAWKTANAQEYDEILQSVVNYSDTKWFIQLSVRGWLKQEDTDFNRSKAAEIQPVGPSMLN